MGLAKDQHHFVRLERLRVNQKDDDGAILLPGVVESQEYYGLYIKYYINVGPQVFKVIEKNDGINIYEPGEKVTVGVHPGDVMSYPADAQ
jgi:iron(III) transport system ATP-binding protein